MQNMKDGLLFTFNGINLRLLFFQFLKDKKISESLTIKYFPTSDFLKKPFQASEETAGYDLLASEAIIILPKSRQCVKIDLKLAIPEGFYGKVFPRSGLSKDHFMTCDSGVIDADYKGVVEIIIINHQLDKVYSIRTGDRTGQIVFMRKYNVKFEEVSEPSLLGRTKLGSDGFGSTGTDKIIKKYKLENDADVIIESVKMSDKSEESESENDDEIIESVKMSMKKSSLKVTVAILRLLKDLAE